MYLDFPQDRAIHTGPIIRRENEYTNMDVSLRKRILTRLAAFTRSCGIAYKTFSYKKSEFGDQSHAESRLRFKRRLAHDLFLFMEKGTEYFSSFDKIIAYYDNGQAIVQENIGRVFAARFFAGEFRKVLPHQDRLCQVADLLCTLELLRCKLEVRELSASELGFFGSADRLRKDYLKQLDKLRFGGGET